MITQILALLTLAAAADTWGPPAVVTHDDQPAVTYRAQVVGGYLAVDVKLEPGWHTFAMDNDKRATAKLAGRKALSMDKPTTIQPEGLEVTGPWLQSPLKDFSEPEILSFSWGFEGEARFLAPAKATGKARVRIKGQACTKSVCKNVDVVAEAPITKGEASTAGLIPVE